MTNLLAPPAKAKFFANNGVPASGFKLFSYAAGTSTKLATYPNESDAVPNSNPIILNFRGEADIWVPPNVAYKFVFTGPNDTDPPTNPIWTVDDIVDSQLVTLWGGVDSGIANQYVLNFAANFTGYNDGIVIYWLPGNSNTAASTINVNGLGPVAITNQDGSALSPGQIQADQVAQILYRGAGFVLLSMVSIITTGSFQLTLNGFAAPVVGTVVFSRIGNLVTLNIPALNITGTSNATTMQGTGVPAELRPTSGGKSVVLSSVMNNGIGGQLVQADIDSSGNILFSIYTGGVFIVNGFTNSGTKGLLVGWTMTYML